MSDDSKAPRADWVMALTKVGDNPSQRRSIMATFWGDPRQDGIAIGDIYRFEDSPDEEWRVADIFRTEG